MRFVALALLAASAHAVPSQPRERTRSLSTKSGDAADDSVATELHELEREFKLLANGQKNLARTLRHLAHDHATEPAVAASEVEPVKRSRHTALTLKNTKKSKKKEPEPEPEAEKEPEEAAEEPEPEEEEAPEEEEEEEEEEAEIPEGVDREDAVAELKPHGDFLPVGSKEAGSESYVSPTALEEMSTYPGIDYLGCGYDIMHGNPQGEGHFMLDPGFRQPVRQMDYSENWLTRDGKYKTPKGSYSMPLKSCYRSEEYSNVASASSFANSLAADASIEGSAGMGGYGASFKASAGYKQTSNEAKQSSFYRFDSSSFCNKYLAAWLHKVPDGSELTPQFADAALAALEGLEGVDPETMSPTRQLEVLCNGATHTVHSTRCIPCTAPTA